MTINEARRQLSTAQMCSYRGIELCDIKLNYCYTVSIMLLLVYYITSRDLTCF